MVSFLAEVKFFSFWPKAMDYKDCLKHAALESFIIQQVRELTHRAVGSAQLVCQTCR